MAKSTKFQAKNLHFCGKNNFVSCFYLFLVLSQAVTFADGTLTINLPAGSYANGEKYCIVIAQAIPEATTITAPVVITIGTGTEE